jgi:hypothetical protein
MVLPLNFPFYNLINKKYNLSWIFYKEFKVVNEDEFSPDFYTYILISNKGDIIYISTDEYKCNDNLTDEKYFIKRRIDTDDVTLSSIDFKHVDFTDKNSILSKKTLITLVDNMITQKIRNLLIN